MMGFERLAVGQWGVLFILTVAVCASRLPDARAAIFTDEFSDGSISNTLWFPPPQTEGIAALTETNGRLEFMGGVFPGAGAMAELESTVIGLRDTDWTVSIDVFIDGGESQFSGIGPGDVIASSLTVSPSGPDSDANGSDGVEINFAFADTTPFGGPGFDHAVRFSGRTNDSENATIVMANNPGPLSATTKLLYDAASQTITGAYDVGSGFVDINDLVVDTSTWGMGPNEVFMFSLIAGAFTLDDNPPTSNYFMSSGQFYFDDFSATGGVVGVPEPCTAGLLCIGAVCLAVVGPRRRKV